MMRIGGRSAASCFLVGFLTLARAVSLAAAQWTAEDIARALRQRESLAVTVRYSYTNTARRLPEGTKILAERLPDGKVLKADETEVVVRTDFVRIRDGERDYLETISFGEDMNTVSGRRFQVWDGTIGKEYRPEKNSGRVTRGRFRMDAGDPESDAKDLLGRPLHEVIADPNLDVDIADTPEGVLVRFQLTPAASVECLLDPEKGFVPKSTKIFRGGLLLRTETVEKYSQHTVDGAALWFPQKVTAEMRIIAMAPEGDGAPGGKPESVPLLQTTVTVTGVEFNPPIPADQFTITFPPDASVYDEHIGRFLPKPSDGVDIAVEEPTDEQAVAPPAEVGDETVAAAPDPPPSEADARAPASPDPPERPAGRRAWYWAAVGIALCILAVLAVIVLTRARSRRTPGR